MNKFVLMFFILIGTSIAFAQEVTDNNITHSQEYYRQQIIVVQKYSKTNFINAVYQGDTKIIEAYVKSGMSADTVMMGLPAVIYAIGANRPESLETLIKNGANMDVKTMGLSPLLFAINKKNPACVKILIENNANVNDNYKGLSALNIALSNKQYDTAEMLLNAGAIIDDDTIIKSIKSENTAIKNLVLKSAVAQQNK